LIFLQIKLTRITVLAGVAGGTGALICISFGGSNTEASVLTWTRCTDTDACDARCCLDSKEPSVRGGDQVRVTLQGGFLDTDQSLLGVTKKNKAAT